MAGYRIFKSTSTSQLNSVLAEIGMNYSDNTITFSDGESVTWTNYIPDANWIIADDDAHFMYVASNAIDRAAIKDTDTNNYKPARVIAENMNGTIVAMAGLETSNSIMTKLNTSQLHADTMSDPTKNDLILAPLIGDFDGLTNKHVFKSLYINYHRWFSFGDIIVSSNGDRYIGIGWILHKIGGGIIKSEYNNAPLHIEIKEVQSYE